MAQDQFIRSIYETVNSHNPQKFSALFTEDAKFIDKSSERIFKGRKQIEGMLEGWFKAFPDMKLQVSNIIGSGNTYCAELSVVGTHNGPLSGPSGEVPATGKKVNAPSCDVITLKNGKIQSLNCYFESAIMMNQLGLTSGKRAA